MPSIELTTLVMIQNPATGEVLVQDRIGSWPGLAFPGGHLDDGESLYACAVREVKEETGLDVRDLKSCGFSHWHDGETGDRYFAFMYKTTSYSGELIKNSDEGRHFWLDCNTFWERIKHQTSNGFRNYLPMFLGAHSEAFGYHTAQETHDMIYY